MYDLGCAALLGTLYFSGLLPFDEACPKRLMGFCPAKNLYFSLQGINIST